MSSRHSTTRLLPLLLASAAIVFACGPRPHQQAKAAAPGAAAAATTPPRKHKLTMALVPTLGVTVGPTVDFAFHVTNDSDKKVEIAFPSGQTHDIAVLDAGGREVWRWSADRMFTQAMQNRVVGGLDTLSFEERWEPKGQTGKFTAVARLTSENHPLEQRVEFEVR